ncbi:hypothetical protein EYF80_017492 [Liparis tanakae]|uniref:Uncharacterized protein n=1 Tax=Liparis tanakae TaxID=230148 RepID=A0A4Z2I3E8_9TELE|nr:hypothetical protein EYF80_017492 [Liparis tanakae]
MGCSTSSQTSAVDTTRPSDKPEESNGVATEVEAAATEEAPGVRERAENSNRLNFHQPTLKTKRRRQKVPGLWFSVASGGRWGGSETIPEGRWPELQSLLGGLKYIRVPARRCLFTAHWALQLPLHLSVVTQEEVPRLSGLRGEAAFIQQRKG